MEIYETIFRFLYNILSVYVGYRTIELFLVSKKIKLVGIDYITVDNEASFTSHLIFLNSEIPILENIDLSSVRPGKYRLYCFPLNTDTEAAPVRVALEVI